MAKYLNGTHSVVFQCKKTDLLGYFGWPTIAKCSDGSLAAGVSGFRNEHVCPFGMSVLFRSYDEGKTWSLPEVVNNGRIDDRDVGLLALPGNRLMMTWFTSDTRNYFNEKIPPYAGLNFLPLITSWSDDMVADALGSFIRICDEHGTWGKACVVKVSAPHGPIRLRDGRIFYLGAPFGEYDAAGKLHFTMEQLHQNYRVQAIVSSDEGMTWQELGMVETPELPTFNCEPHAIELSDGRILGMLRHHPADVPGTHFELWQTISEDGGLSWSSPVYVADGSPPHLLRHSSGVLICTYGYRKPGFGQRVMFSRDEGVSWDTDWILRDDGLNHDLGYPSTVELSDGSLLSIYYQASSQDYSCGLLCSRWTLPEL